MSAGGRPVALSALLQPPHDCRRKADAASEARGAPSRRALRALLRMTRFANAIKDYVILRRLRSGRLEGRTPSMQTEPLPPYRYIDILTKLLHQYRMRTPFGEARPCRNSLARSGAGYF